MLCLSAAKQYCLISWKLALIGVTLGYESIEEVYFQVYSYKQQYKES